MFIYVSLQYNLVVRDYQYNLGSIKVALLSPLLQVEVVV